MKQIRVGVFCLGHENVSVFALPTEQGGEFAMCPDATSTGQIRVGIDYAEWHEVLGVFLHEVLEYALTRKDCRFVRSGKLTWDHADYQFNFDHCQFTDVCAQVAMFLSGAIPALARVYGKNRKIRPRI